ncbi:hypothetical protein HYN59_03710 [Flavobacterium album]|uniref:DUF4348 domain-containing protein n=1 Tax=Flavobacterium album TaxID=2175091 RepID=A0A2S1QV70_9FLAO|nr:DUF4348 domain-containing protein [Flavobacterium album]AWH84274.1 hypothetical protein HYN59_03710 [Flavobacterium album]
MKYALLIFLMLLAGCGKEKQKLTMHMPASHMKEECDTDFDVFFKKFQSDSIFQKRHVKFPLKSSHLDMDGDLSVIREDIPEEKYSFAKFINDKEIGDTGNGAYKIDITKKKDSVYYQMSGIDNGIGTTVKFAFINGCWYMVAVDDTST